GVHDLGALALALLAVALDLRLTILLLAATAAHLLLGLRELCLRRTLCVRLDRVGELRGRADQVQRVHADGMTGRLDGLAAPAGRLQHAELRLQLRGMAPERLEGFANAV